MAKKSDQQKSAEFIDLGHFIFHQYNRVTGMLAYDPDGLYQDIRDQAARILSDEIKEIHCTAEEARTQLNKEIEFLRLKGELIISESLNDAYKRIIDMQSHFMDVMVTLPDLQEQQTNERLRQLEADLPSTLEYNPIHQDAYIAFNIAVHHIVQDLWNKNAQTLNRLTSWTKSRFTTPDFDR